jgi:hypothetical protein
MYYAVGARTSVEERMARKKHATKEEEIAELLRDLLIVQLGLAKVKQNDIRYIAGCSINRVNDILKHLPKGTARRED